MGASNGARSTCCLPKPPGFKASGRRFGKSVASYVRAKSRRTPSGRSHSTRSSISSPACPPPPRHRRCWASIAIIGGSRSCIETRTSSSARTAIRIVATTPPRNIFSLTGFVLKILKSVAPSPTRAIEHFQDDRNRAIRAIARCRAAAGIGATLNGSGEGWWLVGHRGSHRAAAGCTCERRLLLPLRLGSGRSIWATSAPSAHRWLKSCASI